MTIDEAIKHCEEVMMENLEKTKDRNASDPIAINCFECADEHRQLAEWLKELKAQREAWEKMEIALNAMTNRYYVTRFDYAIEEAIDVVKEYRPKEADAE